MKLAFSSSDNTLEAPVDQRFGRAKLFLVYDTDTDTFVTVDNTQNLEASQGAGIQSAQNVVNSGARILVSGHTGPKAFRVLEAAKIDVFLSAPVPVREALALWKKGELQKITQADVEGHWV